MSEHDALSRLYRQLPAEEPSATLDSQVLAAVNAELEAAREQRARWQRRWRYHVPLATAATLVLAVALLLRQPGGQEELLNDRASVTAPDTASAMSPDMAPDMAAEASAMKEQSAGMAAHGVDSSAELRVLAPPPPPPVPVPVPPPMISPAISPVISPAISPPAMVAAPPAVPVMGIVADRALKQGSELDMLLQEAPGSPASEFCTRLRALWPAGETTVEAAPECPTTDGKHQWPAPLAVAWEVNDGRVVRAEERR